MSKKCYLKKYEISKKTNGISKKMKSQKKIKTKNFQNTINVSVRQCQDQVNVSVRQFQ